MEKERKVKITNARTINKMRCIVGLVICAIVIILTTVASILNISNYYHDVSPESGLGTLRMYTTLSNIIAAVCAAICIPFQIDGLRRDRYKLPHWVVELMYVGAVGVLLTFTVAITLISSTSGFVYAMFVNSNLFMHTINPIIITLLFTVAISDAHIKFNRSFFTIIPTFIYALIYYILAFVANVWRDHYHLHDLLPWPVALLLIMLLAYSLSLLLRYL